MQTCAGNDGACGNGIRPSLLKPKALLACVLLVDYCQKGTQLMHDLDIG